MARLSRNFYAGDTVAIARQLLGKYLARRLDGELLLCRITETEAYVGRCDKACHAYQYRRTQRNDVLFGPPAHAYIYFIYGMHYCLNFVTEPPGEPAAVLLRGVQVISGLPTVRRLRFGVTDGPWTAYQRRNFMNGPGKVCQGLGLTREQNGLDLTGDTLFLCDTPADAGFPHLPVPPPSPIHTGPRIGVDYAEEAKDFPWRFWLDTDIKEATDVFL